MLDTHVQTHTHTHTRARAHTIIMFRIENSLACFFENQNTRSCLVSPWNTQWSESTTNHLESSNALWRDSTEGPLTPLN